MKTNNKQAESITPNKAKFNTPAARYPELVKLLARASVLAKELHDELDHQNVANKLEVSKQAFSKQAGKVKVEVK